jgi:hypothetical protein
MTEKKTSELDVAIRELPTSLRMKSQLLSKLWNTEVSENAIDTGAVDADAYLDYYIQQCDIYLIEQKRWAVPAGREFFMTTHQDITVVAKKVVSGHKDRRDIMKEMKMTLHSTSQHPVDGGSLKGGQCDEILGTAIDWAARLVTMLEIGRLQFACQSHEPLTWEQLSLKDYIASVFETVSGRLDTGHIRLEESFNVQSLQKLANLEIEWTNDLMSHLSLRNDDTKVLIFHHVSFLEAMDG